MLSNAYWYLGLSLVSLLLLAYTLFQAKNIRALLLFLIMTEAAFLIETVIYIFGDSYSYHPGLLKSSAYYDSNIGALTSNMFVVPTAAVIIAVFQWRWKRIVAMIIAIGFIEWLFVKLEIYTLYWWRREYTLLGLLLYFPMARMLYDRLRRPITGVLHSLLLFMCIAPIMGTLHILPVMLFMNRSYDPGWFTDPSHDTTAFSSVYYLVVTSVIVLIIKLQRGYEWIKRLAIVLFITIGIRGFIAAGLLNIHAWWDPWFYCVFPPTVYVLFKPVSTRLAKGT